MKSQARRPRPRGHDAASIVRLLVKPWLHKLSARDPRPRAPGLGQRRQRLDEAELPRAALDQRSGHADEQALRVERRAPGAAALQLGVGLDEQAVLAALEARDDPARQADRDAAALAARGRVAG